MALLLANHATLRGYECREALAAELSVRLHLRDNIG
jgi:hypothetical protein